MAKKKKRIKPRFNAVYVEWIDAFSMSGSGWKDESDFENLRESKFIIRELGFVIGENDDYLTLVGGYDQEECGWEPTYHRDVKIPKGTIRKRIDLTKYIT